MTEGFYVATVCDQIERFYVAIEKFYVATQLARLGRNSVSIKYFYVAIELAKVRKNYVATKQFYVMKELAMVGRIFVVIKDFDITTELASTEGSTVHDRAGRARLAHARQSCTVLYQDRAWSWEEVPMSRPDILGRD